CMANVSACSIPASPRNRSHPAGLCVSPSINRRKSHSAPSSSRNTNPSPITPRCVVSAIRVVVVVLVLVGVAVLVDVGSGSGTGSPSGAFTLAGGAPGAAGAFGPGATGAFGPGALVPYGTTSP